MKENIYKIKSKSQKHYIDTNNFFDEAALKRDGYYDKKGSIPHKTQQSVRNIVISLMKVDKENYDRILDIGCGMGDFSIFLSQLLPKSKIIGMDYSKNMISLCDCAKNDYGGDNIEFKVADILNTPFEDCEFDIIVCINVIHHIHRKDLDKAVEEISRITKKTVVLEIKNRNTPYYLIKKLRSILSSKIVVCGTTSKEIKKSFGRYGFNLTNVTPIFRFEISSPIMIMKFDRGGG